MFGHEIGTDSLQVQLDTTVPLFIFGTFTFHTSLQPQSKFLGNPLLARWQLIVHRVTDHILTTCIKARLDPISNWNQRIDDVLCNITLDRNLSKYREHAEPWHSEKGRGVTTGHPLAAVHVYPFILMSVAYRDSPGWLVEIGTCRGK